MADISKVKLPDGVTYNIKDAVARAALGGGSMRIVWSKTQQSGTTAPTTAQKAAIPNAATIYYGSSSTTGTLAPSADTLNTFYLVADRSVTGESGDYYDEWVTILEGTSYVWEKVGDTQFTGNLSITDDTFIKSLSIGTHTHSVTVGTKDIQATASSSSTNSKGAHTHTVTPTGTYIYGSASATTAATGGTHKHDFTPNGTYITATATGGAVTGNGSHRHTQSGTTKYIGATATGTAATGGGHSHSLTGTKSYITATATGGAVTGDGNHRHAVTYGGSWMGVSISGGGVSGGGYSSPTSGTVGISVTKRDFTKSNALIAATSTTTGAITYISSLNSGTVNIGNAETTTVATGGVTDSDNGHIVTNVTAPKTVQGRTSKNVVTAATVQANVLTTAVYTSSDETLTFSTGTQSRTNGSVYEANAAATTTLTLTKANLDTTTVRGATAQSISVIVDGTPGYMAPSSFVTGIGTSSGTTVATGVSLSGTTTFLTGLGTFTAPTYTSPSVSIAQGASAAGKVYFINSVNGSTEASTVSLGFTQPTITTSVTTTSTANSGVFYALPANTGSANVGTLTFTQPTITLAANDNTATGRVGVITALSASTGSANVSHTFVQPAITLSKSSTSTPDAIIVADNTTTSTSEDGAHTHSVGAPTITLATGSSASGRALVASTTVITSSENGSHSHTASAQNITLASGTTRSVAVGAPGAVTTGINTGDIFTGVSTSGRAITSVTLN